MRFYLIWIEQSDSLNLERTSNSDVALIRFGSNKLSSPKILNKEKRGKSVNLNVSKQTSKLIKEKEGRNIWEIIFLKSVDMH